MERSVIEKISSLITVGGEDLLMSEDVGGIEMLCCECGSSYLDLMTLNFNRRTPHFCRFCGRICCRKCLDKIPNLQQEDEKEGGFTCSLCRQCNETPYFTPQISPSPSIMSFSSCASSFGDLSSNFLSSDRNYDDYEGQYGDQYDDDEEDRDPYNSGCSVVANSQSQERYLDESVVDLSGRVSPGPPISKGEAPGTKNEYKEENGRDHIYGDHKCQERADLESSMFVGSDSKSEQTPFRIDIDIHNNSSIYLPPKPEEEYEDSAVESNGSVLADDDDDYDDEGLPRSPEMRSISSKKHKIKENMLGEEHKISMKAVVDGHFRFLVHQLLGGENLDVETWKEIVCSVAWEAALYIKPAASEGKAMDPGGYAKVKCVACGNRNESKVIKGVVFKKNVAHKHMPTRYNNPRLLLLGGALEYERASNQQLSSLDTLLQEEIEYLNNVVKTISEHHPDVLLVEKTVARRAQEILLNKKISLVLDVKKCRLERIAQCTGAQIISSVDNLSLSHIKHCDLFHVEKFVEEHGSAGEAERKLTKTLMFFEGCAKPLGCTILLKGASGDELKRVKRVVQYAVFAAYQLALETSFLADERASILESSSNATASIGKPRKQMSLDSSLCTSPGFAVPGLGKWHGEVQKQFKDDKDMTISPFMSSDSNYDEGESKPNSPTSASKTTKFASMPISLDVCQTSKTMHQKGTNGVSDGFTKSSISSSHIVSGLSASLKKALGEALPNIGSGSYAAITSYFGIKGIECKNFNEGDVSAFSAASQDHHHGDSSEEAPGRVRLRNEGITDDQNDSNSLEHQPVIENKNQDGAYLEEQGLSRECISSNLADHPSILVSFSSRCTLKGTVCERSHLSRIKYYGSSDKSLGRFLWDRLFDQNFHCQACGEPPTAHAYCYTHQQGKLAISVQKFPSGLGLPGEREGKIWMWYRCLKCPWKDGIPQGNRRVVMSDAASGLSFGKFLELSFSNHAAASRVASCGHSLHRECLRFYGLGNTIACFHYSAISVFGVRLPLPKIEFNNPNQQEWLTKEVVEVSKKGRELFSEIFTCIHQSNFDTSGSYPGRAVLEGMLQKEREEFEVSLQKAFTENWQPRQPAADILELNRLRWQLLFESCVWEYRLRHLNSPNKVVKSSVNSFCDLQDLNSSVEKENKSLEKLGSSLMTHNMVNGITTSKVHVDGCAVNNKRTDNEEAKAGSDLEITDAVVESISVPGSLQDSNSIDQLTEVQRVYDKPSNFIVGIDSRQTHLVLPDGKEPVRGLNTPGHILTCEAAYGECLNNSNSSGSQPDSLVGSRDNVDLQEEDLEIHKTPSEGRSLNLPDFTETFDAAWTGDLSLAAQAALVKSHGQGIVNGHSVIENSGASELPQEAVCKSVQQSQDQSIVKMESCDSGFEMQDKDGLELVHPNMPSLPVKSFDVLKDIESLIWHPFSDFFMVCIKDSQKFLSICKLIRCCTPMFLKSAFKLLNEGGARLLLPPGIDNTVIAVYDDEPTSLIAYALSSKQYWAQISDDPLEDRQKENFEDIHREALDSTGTDIVVPQPLKHIDSLSEMAELGSEGRSTSSTGASTSGSHGASAADQSLRTKIRHAEICFGDENQLGKVKYSVLCYHAKQFSALQKTCCPTEMEFIRSLSRCKKWGAQGGKSKVFFAKTLDERFIIKQVTKIELESFLEFAPEYFKHLTFSLSTGSPTCLAKILGIYQVTIKHSKGGGKDVKMDLMVMENLLFGKSVTRVYDLKGSLRNRYNPDSSGVLLDQNFIEAMLTSPTFVSNKAKHHLERAVWNDTSFLNSIHVMDYSLLVGVDEERQELVLGIIDFMRQYTWDKHLETWVKTSGILGGPKNEKPTVISPKEYKKRFRKAISTYFQSVPDSWPPHLILSQIESGEYNRKESDGDQIH